MQIGNDRSREPALTHGTPVMGALLPARDKAEHPLMR